MSKMKHLLRKLHIGDHHNHHGRPPTDPSPTLPSTSSSSTTTSPSSDLPQTTPNSDNDTTNNNFNFFEEEFQMQLALAISVSDQGQSSVDSEIAQIDAAKQISLGCCSPTQTLPDSLSLRYWNNDVVNYDEKIVDGFYDVCGVDSNLVVQSKMPSLVDLEAIPVSGDAGYEVVVVNRAVDLELRHLEESVYLMSTEYRVLDRSRNTSILVQKLADLIVQRMGGPVTDVEEMIRRWRIRNHELRLYSNTIMLPLGSLDVGHSRQRALLFKVLADRIGLPCKLVKGSYYTGTDEGAVNLIKLDSGSEYIIDLMGAPGTLIPSEVPSSHHQSFGLDGRTSASHLGAGTGLSRPYADETVKLSSSSTELCPTGLLSNHILLTNRRKRSAEGLGENELIMDIAGHKLPVNTLSKLDYAERRNDNMNPINDVAFFREQVGLSGNEEAMEIVCSSQLDTSNSHNTQMDHAINGVAEILWEDLHIGERIGIGSYGEVYHGEWNGTEVAVKKFMKQDISGTALAQFRCEIEIMMRLRHPNVVLFMGAVMRPPNMSILTEFLPRGSLYKLLHRPNIQIDEKKRIKMALDVAKGMNYLHTSNPIIVHRDLKTPNLLVDKNWVVKVCDFGMSRLQHNTFLSSKSAAGTAEWMAPEVLRNEQSNEKSDIYSFGVILWELATMRVPWTEMNSMQVVGAVGWQGRHLDIPPSVDPTVAEIISECWNRSPQMRPSFKEIITRLKGLEYLTIQRLENPLNYQ